MEPFSSYCCVMLYVTPALLELALAYLGEVKKTGLTELRVYEKLKLTKALALSQLNT